MAKPTDIAESKAASSPIGVGTVLATFRRRPLQTAAVVLVAVAAAAVVWKKIPDPKNTGYALFQMQALQPHILDPQQSENIQIFRQSQGTLVKSRHILNSALKEPRVEQSGLLKGESNKVSALADLVKVDFRSGPEFMRVTVEGNDREELQVIIDAIAKSYLDHMVHNHRNAQRLQQESLERTASSLKIEIGNTEKLLKQSIESQDEMTRGINQFEMAARRTQYTAQKDEAETQLRQAEIELDLLKNQKSPRTAADATAVAADRSRLLGADPSYRALIEQRDQRRALAQETRKRLAPGVTNAGLVAIETELNSLEEQCQDIENRVQAQAEALAAKIADQNRAIAIEQAELQVARYQRAVASLEKALRALSTEDRRAVAGVDEGMRLSLERNRALLHRVQDKLAVLQIEADAPARVVQLESDVLPGEGGKRSKMTLAAGAGVLCLGLAGLVVLDRRNPLVLTVQQVTDQLQLPLLGIVPTLLDNPKSAASAVTGAPSDWQVSAMEAVCGTRTLLQYGVSQAAQQARIILIGSAVSGEGKTSLSLLLARSLAQAGNRTLLIDGDLRRPTMHASLCVPGSPGLCEYLTGRVDLSEICYPSDSPDLTVIPGGVWSDAASQALAGPSRWPDLVRRVTVEYDYVLIDSSPFLPVTDALLMARVVDGVLLTVMREVSEVNAVKEALAQLALIGARVLGVVVNGGPLRRYYRPRDEHAAAEPPAIVPAAAP